MTLKIYGSSSAGNCYILDNGQEALMIEAGVSAKRIVKTMGMGILRIAGCIISHEHGDHASQAPQLYGRYSIPMYASKGTIDAIKWDTPVASRLNILRPNKVQMIGGFKVLAFEAKHDAKEPLLFLIWHQDMGWLLFATDTYLVPVSIQGINHILIECNYAEDRLKENLERGVISYGQYERTYRSHMSIQACEDYIKSQDLQSAWEIILIHLSDDNSIEQEFIDRIQEAAGPGIQVTAAPKNEYREIELIKN